MELEQPTKAPSPPAGLSAVFHRPLFMMVWTGTFISNIGNWMENSGQNWAVVKAPGISDKTAAILAETVNFADFLPILLLSLLAGVIADRVNLRRYMLLLQAIACVLASLLAAAAYTGHATPAVVIAFTFLEGIIWALNGPPSAALLPHLIPRNELPAAIAAQSVQFNLARLIGPFIAGILIVHVGIAAAFAVNAITFLPVMIALFKLPVSRRRSGDASPRLPANGREPIPVGTEPLMRAWSSGLRLVWKHPGMKRLALMIGTFMFFSAPATGLLAPYVREHMGGDARIYGAMLGAIGLGALLGALIIRRVPAYYPRHHLIPLSICLAALFLILFTFTNSAVVGFIILTCAGFFWILATNSTGAGMQLLADDSSRGRVMSVLLLCNPGLLPLGHFFAGALASTFPTAWVMRSMEAALFLAGLAFLLWREPAIDSMPLVEGAHPPAFFANLWEALTAQSHRPIPEPLRTRLAQDQSTASQSQHSS